MELFTSERNWKDSPSEMWRLLLSLIHLIENRLTLGGVLKEWQLAMSGRGKRPKHLYSVNLFYGNQLDTDLLL